MKQKKNNSTFYLNILIFINLSLTKYYTQNNMPKN